MILMVSGRTDIVAFYTKWFLNRYREGYVDVRNPFYPKNVSRIYFQDVDAILFCTKNPLPIINHLHKNLLLILLLALTLNLYKSFQYLRQMMKNIFHIMELVKKREIFI